MSSRTGDEPPAVQSQRHPLVVASSLQARLAVIFLLYTGIGVAAGVAAAVMYPAFQNHAGLSVVYYTCLSLLVLGAIGLSIVTANRLAGPIYRLELTIDQVLADRHLDRVVRLREGDEFQGLAARLTHLLQEWRLEAATDRAVADHIRNHLEQLEHAVAALAADAGRDQALGLVQECRADIARLVRSSYMPDPPADEAISP